MNGSMNIKYIVNRQIVGNIFRN